jgi:hypothetical protein
MACTGTPLSLPLLLVAKKAEDGCPLIKNYNFRFGRKKVMSM